MDKYPSGPPPADAPAITRLRVTDKRATGVHVRFETADGQQRQAWVPMAILEDAKRRIEEHQRLVAATDGGAPLGAAAVDVIAILCAQTGPGFDDALYEASWVGPAPELPQPVVYDRVQPQSPTAIDQEISAVHPHLGRGAVAEASFEPAAPRARPSVSAASPVEPMTLVLMGLAGAAAAAVGVLGFLAWAWAI